jgi:hypothetical protein
MTKVSFDTVWIDGLLYNLTILNFPSYLLHTIPSHLLGRTFEVSFQTVTSSRRGMQAGVTQGALISTFFFCLYVNDMPTSSHHVELALYADDTAIIATSRKPPLLVRYLESYLSDLQQSLNEWRIAISVSKSTAIIFARFRRSFVQRRPVTTVFGDPIHWVDTTRYLGITLNKWLTWSPNVYQVRKKNTPGTGLLRPLLNRRSDSPSGTASCYTSSLSAPLWTMRIPFRGPLSTPTSGGCRCYNPSFFALLRAAPCT